MKVEAKMAIKDRPQNKSYDLDQGDTITVPDPVGEYWVANGWAKNLDTGEDNQLSDKPVTLDVHNSVLGNTTEEVK